MFGLSLAFLLPGASQAAKVWSGMQFLERHLETGVGTPSQIAEKFAAIENDWDAQARLFLSCSTSTEQSGPACQTPILFKQSCAAVAASFAQRGGNRVGVHSFMNTLCDQSALSSEGRDPCHGLSAAIEDEMETGKDAKGIDVNSLCQQFWGLLVQQARASRQETAAATAPPAAAMEEATPGMAAASPVAQVAAGTPSVLATASVLATPTSDVPPTAAEQKIWQSDTLHPVDQRTHVATTVEEQKKPVSVAQSGAILANKNADESDEGDDSEDVDAGVALSVPGANGTATLDSSIAAMGSINVSEADKKDDADDDDV